MQRLPLSQSSSSNVKGGFTTFLELDGVAAALAGGRRECRSHCDTGAATVVWAVIPTWDGVGW